MPVARLPLPAMKQTAIITGASQGIGAAIAKELAALGFHVVLLSRRGVELEKVCETIQNKGGSCTWFVCDVSKAAEIELFFEKLQQLTLPPPSVLVNNAGWGGPFQSIDAVAEADWDAIFAVNVKSAYLFCRRLLPLMREQGFGRIINIASVYGSRGGAGSVAYTAAKHALLGLTRAVSVEWGAHNITCNTISPGFIDTPMTAEASTDFTRRVTDSIPSHRYGTAEEVAKMVAFLAGTNSAYVNGADLVVDGGLIAGFSF